MQGSKIIKNIGPNKPSESGLALKEMDTNRNVVQREAQPSPSQKGK